MVCFDQTGFSGFAAESSGAGKSYEVKKLKKTIQRYHAVVHGVNTVMSCVNIR